jgi:hypothetical protein
MEIITATLSNWNAWTVEGLEGIERLAKDLPE